MELVITIAVAGTLSTLVVNMTSGVPATVAHAKLESDVVLLNQLVGLYLADGGDLEGMTSPQSVLDSLKRACTAEEMKSYTGVASGKLVDVRLRARMGSGNMGGGLRGRAVWNSSRKRFEIVEDGNSGVDEFYLDETLASTRYGTSSRRSRAVSFNKSNGWVWGSSVASNGAVTSMAPTYVDPAGSQAYFNPNEPAGSTSGSGGSSGSGSGGSGAGSSGGGSSLGGGGIPQLPRPVITPSGDTYAYSSFPASVTISSNGAIEGQSKLVYQKNNAAWEDYSASITVESGDTIEAQNVTLNPGAYVSSIVAEASYYRLVSSITGDETSSWTGITGGGNLTQSITTDGQTITLTHGNTKLDLGGGQYLDAGVQNVISFTQGSFSGIAPNAWFKLGDVTMLNGTTFYDSEASGATLKLDFNLGSPSAASSIDINLGFISNENTSDALASADIVEIKNPATGTVFDFGGVSYSLELTWVSLDPAAGVVQGSQFLIFEGASATAELRARFVPDR